MDKLMLALVFMCGFGLVGFICITNEAYNDYKKLKAGTLENPSTAFVGNGKNNKTNDPRR